MTKRSAGLLLHRGTGTELQVLIAHMGGPLWAKRDKGAWSIPKGEYGPDEDAFAAACREFTEELGAPVPAGEFRPLGEISQRNAKVVTAWALDAEIDASTITSNTFEMPWPPRSGRIQAFPEIDRAEWFDLHSARARLVSGQAEFLDRLSTVLSL